MPQKVNIILICKNKQRKTIDLSIHSLHIANVREPPSSRET